MFSSILHVFLKKAKTPASFFMCYLIRLPVLADENWSNQPKFVGRQKKKILLVVLHLWIVCPKIPLCKTPGCAYNPEKGFSIKKSKTNMSGSQVLLWGNIFMMMFSQSVNKLCYYTIHSYRNWRDLFYCTTVTILTQCLWGRELLFHIGCFLSKLLWATLWFCFCLNYCLLLV